MSSTVDLRAWEEWHYNSVNLAKNALPKGDAFKLRLSFLENGLRKWKIELLLRSGELAKIMKAKSFSGIFTKNAEQPSQRPVCQTTLIPL